MKIQIWNDIFLRMSEVDSSACDIWFIHGFGGSGQIFNEVFSSPLRKSNNIYVPDLPSCGVTPPIFPAMSIQDTTDLLETVIRKISANRLIVIVAHSLGGVIGTWLCCRLKDQVKTYINVEGNLTEEDAYFCGLASNYDSEIEFHNIYKNKVFAILSESEEAFHRHYASVIFAHSKGLYVLGKSGALATGEKKSGEEFTQLKCNKYYYWSEKSTPKQTRDYIKNMNLPNRHFTDCGHWPMIDKPDKFYQAILADI